MSQTGFKCKLRVIFAEREIKHGDFAEKVGIKRGTLSSIVNDRSLPRFELTYVVLEELKLGINDVWIKEGNKKSSPDK